MTAQSQSVLLFAPHSEQIVFTLKSFLENKVPSDDTQASKFLSLLSYNIHGQESCSDFLLHSDVTSLLGQKLTSDLCEESFVFFVKLLSHIYTLCPSVAFGSVEESFKNILHLPFQDASCLWNKASVRHAWISAIKTAATQRPQVCIPLCIAEDFIKPLLSTYNDDSLFVKNISVSCCSVLVMEILALSSNSAVLDSSLNDQFLALTEKMFNPLNSPKAELQENEIHNACKAVSELQHYQQASQHSVDLVKDFLERNAAGLLFNKALKISALNRHYSLIPPLTKTLMLPSLTKHQSQVLPFAFELYDSVTSPLCAVLIMSSVINCMEPSKVQSEKMHTIVTSILKAFFDRSVSNQIAEHLKNHKEDTKRIILISMDILKQLPPQDSVLALFTDYVTLAASEPNSCSAALKCRLLQTAFSLIERFSIQKLEKLRPSIAKFLSACLCLLSSSHHNHQIYKSCLTCIESTMIATKSIYSVSEVGETETSFADQMCEILQKRLCDLSWEIRDTTLEFIAQVFRTYQDVEKEFTNWIIPSRLHFHVVQCLCDSERYVRATAINALLPLFSNSTGGIAARKSFLIEGINVVNQIGNIAFNDAELFPRRASYEFLAVIKCDDFDSSAAMKKAIHDDDWQIKKTAISYCRTLSENPDISAEDHVCKCGAILLTGVFDCDRSVQLDACNVIKEIFCDYLKTAIKRHGDKEETQWDGCEIGSVEKFTSILNAIDIEKRLREAALSTDEYDSNPASLLTDVVSSLTVQVQADDDNDDFMIDCY